MSCSKRLYLLLPVALLLLTVMAQAAPSPTWAGRWIVSADQFPPWRGPPGFTFTQKGTTVTARHALKFYAETVKNGSVTACNTAAGGKIAGKIVKGREVKATITFPNARGALYLTLSPNGREIVGQMNVVRGPCSGTWGAFNAKRKK